jgi:hypothetical protein
MSLIRCILIYKFNMWANQLRPFFSRINIMYYSTRVFFPLLQELNFYFFFLLSLIDFGLSNALLIPPDGVTYHVRVLDGWPVTHIFPWEVLPCVWANWKAALPGPLWLHLFAVTTQKWWAVPYRNLYMNTSKRSCSSRCRQRESKVIEETGGEI